MTPRLEACYFAPVGTDGRWTRLSRVLDYTAHQHCPNWRVRVALVEPPPAPSRMQIRAYESNTQKLDRWSEIVSASEDGEQILLMDADTLIVRALDDIWERAFDFAYTTKTAKAAFPINGGVVFVRVSERVKAFVSDWATENRRLLADSDQKASWRKTHGGINQASLASLLPHATERGLQVLELACREWNCEDSAWESFDPAVTRILHIKSELRQACLSPFPSAPALKPLKELWRATELAAKAALVGGSR